MKSMPRRLPFAMLVALLGCSSTNSPDTPPDASATDGPTCFADFPCGHAQLWRCIDDVTAQRNESHDCHFGCGPGPCSGGSCDPTGPVVHCVPPRHCIPASLESSASSSPCGDLASPDGGPDGALDAAKPDARVDVAPDVAPESATDGSETDADAEAAGCLTDFPCDPSTAWTCIDDVTAQMNESHDCHFTCGPGPCGGGSCDPTGPVVHCVAPERCVPASWSVSAPCAAPDAGSDAAADVTDAPD